MPSLHHTTAHLFRHESGKMLSALVRLFGLSQVEIAEDIVQDTLLTAFESWKIHGLPDQPKAWLYRTAKNKTVDFLRRERNFQSKIAPRFAETMRQNDTSDTWLDTFFLDDEIEDAQLRMMFACCHPAIPFESQLVLMLRTLCGLSIREIATAFLLPEDTVGKRLTRAKDKIRQERLSLEPPKGEDLAGRLDAVLQAVYLLFNEGYKSSTGASVIRRELCEEALRLGGLLTRNALSDLPKTHALQALLCFQASRFDARLDAAGDIILLEHQDRNLWNRGLIALGYEHLRQSARNNEMSEYHIEAAIASYHASAPVFEKTNWQAIFYCYNLLMRVSPSPFVALNRAIARGYAEGPAAGIEALLKIEGLDGHYLYHTALGDFYVKNGNGENARACYQRALELVALGAEKKVLERKLAGI
ncbi:MAG TPA: sigma-70 family RNA polymerase sigma factor [Saprospiraceae bacterium]|nr:sigma-70 family RNA polymerase sigma factor [Saprospiraceae bacterium]HPI06924.1 sigma-70 family RNA polymerase sigma factor [Saprospiraceae bacterium]